MIQFSAPAEIEIDLWQVEVTFVFSDRKQLFKAIGGDSIDALLNALALSKRQIELEPEQWKRFPDRSDDWHWFPLIPPSLGREFDSILRNAVDAEHASFCNRQKSIQPTMDSIDLAMEDKGDATH